MSISSISNAAIGQQQIVQNRANLAELANKTPGGSVDPKVTQFAGRTATVPGQRVAASPQSLRPGQTFQLAQADKAKQPQFKEDGSFKTPDEKLNLPALNQTFETGAKTQDMLKSLAYWERVGVTSRNVSLASSAKEQAQGVWNNVVTNATLEVTTLTAVANRINVLYGKRVIDLNDRQRALASINLNIAKLRAVVDVANASISQIGLSNTFASGKQDAARLNLTMKSWQTTIAAAQKSVAADLKLADQQVAQLKVTAQGELISGNVALQGISDEILGTASQTAKSAYTPEGVTSAAVDKKNGVALPPAISRGGDARSLEQRYKLAQRFFPFLQAPALKIGQPAAGASKTPTYTVDGIDSRTGASAHKNALERLTKSYGNLDNAAKELKLSGKQLTNLIESVQSGKFDASKLGKDYSALKGSTNSLLKVVSTLPSKMASSLDAYPTREDLTKTVAQEFSDKIKIPQALRDYAKKVGADVDLLVALATFNMAQEKAEAVTDSTLDIGINPLSPASYIKSAKNLGRLLSTEKLTAIGNTLGNTVRVNRLFLAYKNPQLATETKNTAWSNLDNVVSNYGLGVGVYRENLASVKVSLDSIKTQQQTLKNNYMNAVVGQKSVGVGEQQLSLLKKQYELANANLESVAQGKRFALSVGKERLQLSTASNERKTFDSNVSKVLRDMTGWNATFATNAYKYTRTDYAATGQGLIIPPTVLSKVMGNANRAPTSAELQRAGKETMAAFHQRYPQSANMIVSGVPAAKAAVQFFLTGDSAAVTSRSPIQQKIVKPRDVDDRTPRAPFDISKVKPEKTKSGSTLTPSLIPVPKYSEEPKVDRTPKPGTRSMETQNSDYVLYGTPHDVKK